MSSSNNTNKISNDKISNDEPTKPVVNPTTDKKPVVKDDTGDNTGPIVGGQKTVGKPQNVVHTIRNVYGKDDNTNRIRNVADVDITDKWAFDSYPLQLVVELEGPKELDYVRICSENEQPYTLDFSNDNTLEGYSRAQKGTLKRGLNDIKLPTDIVAQYLRFDFSGNKAVDENKDKKADPLGIYYVQAGSGEINTSTPLPEPGPIVPAPEPTNEPPKPTEGRIKDWGADIEKGADKWRIIRMNQNAKFYKVTDEAGVNIADMFTTPEKAKEFVTWHQWEQGQDTPTPPDPEPTVPGPGPNPPGPTPGGEGVTKDGVQLLYAPLEINYDHSNNFRDDGKRFDFNCGANKNFVNAELIGYFRFKDGKSVDDEVSGKQRGGVHHEGSTPRTYDIGVEILTGNSRYRTEEKHPDYKKGTAKDTESGKGIPLKDKYVGYKFITKNAADKKSVNIQVYQDVGNNEGVKPANEWKLVSNWDVTEPLWIDPPKDHQETLRIDDPAKKGQKDLEAKWLACSGFK